MHEHIRPTIRLVQQLFGWARARALTHWLRSQSGSPLGFLLPRRHRTLVAMRSSSIKAFCAAAVLLCSTACFSCSQVTGNPASGPADKSPKAAETFGEPMDPALTSGTTTSSPAASTQAPKTVGAAQPDSAGAVNDRGLNDYRAIITANRDKFRACYEASLKAHPGVHGTVMLKFLLAPDGSMKEAAVEPDASEIHADDLDRCLIATVKGLKFPPSKRGMESTVRYPFTFSPGGGRPASSSGK